MLRYKGRAGAGYSAVRPRIIPTVLHCNHNDNDDFNDLDYFDDLDNYDDANNCNRQDPF